MENENGKIVWYKEKTYLITLKILFVLGLLAVISTSIYDEELNLIGLWFWVFALVVVTPLQYLYKK